MPSALVAYLMQQMLWGHMSAPSVQKIAKLARDDMMDFIAVDNTSMPDLDFLAGCGTEGEHPRHIYRDIMDRISFKSIPMSYFMVPI